MQVNHIVIRRFSKGGFRRAWMGRGGRPLLLRGGRRGIRADYLFHFV